MATSHDAEASAKFGAGLEVPQGHVQHADSREEKAAPIQLTKCREDEDEARGVNTKEDADNRYRVNTKEDADNRGGMNKEEDADNGGGEEKEEVADNSRDGDTEAEEDCIQLREQEEGNQREEHNREPWRPTAGNTTSKNISRPLGERQCKGAGHIPGGMWPHQVQSMD
ncbi:hypothetical protein NDU88_006225 [Pleurodeles waltl]|uniref:Uncharacterized protein n=1 Tax=Pleurodeles waltl TaxID=8319 RepID=A0AAV7MYL4_PLEWA|nr:hypothetical protein NDU88_006225 [Pleurodeles waltl]